MRLDMYARPPISMARIAGACTSSRPSNPLLPRLDIHDAQRAHNLQSAKRAPHVCALTCMQGHPSRWRGSPVRAHRADRATRCSRVQQAEARSVYAQTPAPCSFTRCDGLHGPQVQAKRKHRTPRVGGRHRPLPPFLRIHFCAKASLRAGGGARQVQAAAARYQLRQTCRRTRGWRRAG